MVQADWLLPGIGVDESGSSFIIALHRRFGPEMREIAITLVRWFRAIRSSLPAAFIASALALSCLLLGLNAVWALQERGRALKDARIGTENLSRSLAQHAHDTIQAIDAVLVDLRERVEVDGMAHDQLDRLHQMMVSRANTLPLARRLFLYNATGLRIARSIPGSDVVGDASDRGYFQDHARAPDRGVHIGAPMHSKADDAWVITVSRRVDGPNGAFAGVVVASIPVDLFQHYYSAFNVGQTGGIVLDMADGTLIARNPNSPSMIGKATSGGAIYQDYLQHGPVGTFRNLPALDGVVRLGSYRRVDTYPLVVIVANGLDEALSDWRAKTWNHFLANMAVAAALILTSALFARQIKHRRQADYLYRLLANNSTDAIICMTLDEKMHYISPTLVRMIGWPVEAHLTQPWQAFIHPDDVGHLVALKETLMRGAPQATASFRYICKDGSHLWVEARVQLLEADPTKGISLVANIRDITERKAADKIVAELNQELMTQANTDGLTGLANRRCFDGALEQEWRRASREANVLSLIMIDVDRFKPYNDQYGHQQGDSCLRMVCLTIAQFIHRTGDLVARFGGEEIVVLLPGVHAHAAIELAETIRAAIQAVGIEHAGNPPSGVVTASFGVATLLPRLAEAETGPEELVTTADAALYEAKRTGRNRVISPLTRADPTKAPATGTEVDRAAEIYNRATS